MFLNVSYYGPGWEGVVAYQRDTSMTNSQSKKPSLSWLVWLSGLRAGLQTRGLPVQFLFRAHAWVAGQVSGRWRKRGNHILMFPFFLFHFPSLKINKHNFFLKDDFKIHPSTFMILAKSSLRDSYSPISYFG